MCGGRKTASYDTLTWQWGGVGRFLKAIPSGCCSAFSTLTVTSMTSEEQVL